MSFMSAPGGPHFACDAMLANLAHWLRAAGYDTTLATGGVGSDRDLLAHCRAEARILPTRDRHLAAHANPAIERVLLTVDDLDGQAAALAGALDLDWNRALFSRCLLDNAPLHEATPLGRERVPSRARDLPGPFRACAVCARVYWPGSHVRACRHGCLQWQALARPTRRR